MKLRIPLLFVISLLFVLPAAAPFAHAQEWAKARLEASPRHREYVKLTHGSRTVEAYVVYPEVSTKAPAVILIHEIFGLTDWAKEMADEIAAQGYIVIAPDLLTGLGPGGGDYSSFTGQDAVMKAVSGLDPDQVNADLDAAADYGKRLPAADGWIAVVGFCWGGTKVVRLCGAPEGLVGGIRFLRIGAQRCFDDYRAGVRLLRGQRRAHRRDAACDQGREGGGQAVSEGDLQRGRTRLYARGRGSCGYGRREQDGAGAGICAVVGVDEDVEEGAGGEIRDGAHPILQLLPQLDQRGALAAFVLGGFGDGGDVGMGFEEFADAAAEDAGAVAVDDADAGRPARKARSRYFSNSSVASSTVRPMRLISMRRSSVLALVTVTWTFSGGGGGERIGLS